MPACLWCLRNIGLPEGKMGRFSVLQSTSARIVCRALLRRLKFGKKRFALFWDTTWQVL
jgi:hypothetical protein